MMTVRKRQLSNPSARCQVWRNVLLVWAADATTALRMATSEGQLGAGDVGGTLRLSGGKATAIHLGVESLHQVGVRLRSGTEILRSTTPYRSDGRQLTLPDQAHLKAQVSREFAYEYPDIWRPRGRRSGRRARRVWFWAEIAERVQHRDGSRPRDESRGIEILRRLLLVQDRNPERAYDKAARLAWSSKARGPTRARQLGVESMGVVHGELQEMTEVTYSEKWTTQARARRLPRTRSELLSQAGGRRDHHS